MPDLSEEQRAAVEMTRNTRLSLISGPPGSGKSTLIAAICALYTNALLIAPTATASDRMKACCPGTKSYTIDKVLCEDKATRKQFEDRPTIVDEGGMMSTAQLLDVYRFVKPSRLVVVGDEKQLGCVDEASVKKYSALHTLMQHERVPRVVLTERWRRHGKEPGAIDAFITTIGTPEFNPRNQDATFRIVECETQDECYAKAAEAYKPAPAQILAYTNKAVDKLNELTENLKAKVLSGRTRVGDRVVCTENFYNKDKDLLVANGTCGTANGSRVAYDNGYVDSLKTRFVPCRAMTVSKSQGNEYAVKGIVVVAPWNGEPPLELLYTAVSRFKESATVYVRKTQVRQIFVLAKFKAEAHTDVIDELDALFRNATTLGDDGDDDGTR